MIEATLYTDAGCPWAYSANPEFDRVSPPDSPEPLLAFFPGGLTTAKVALLLAEGSDPVPDLEAAAASLSGLVSDGKAVRATLGSDALWSLPPTTS